MRTTNRIDVYMGERHVGSLAETEHRAAFQYSEEWVENGFSISPFSLPLSRDVYVPEYQPFEGVFGVFADTLPDGWGRLIVDRYIKEKLKLNASEISSYQRLMLVSESGMGALRYHPSEEIRHTAISGDYDKLAQECRELLEENDVEDLDTLFQYGGSSGGARPKIHTHIDDDDWIIKFPSSYDSKNSGRQEYEYSLCAKECGIEMSDTKLFDSRICEGYFGTKRFDRKKDGTRIHMVSVSGLLETSHRYPNLDYNQLLKLTMILTQDSNEVRKMFDLMCFNVYAHNRDDHSKNFSYLYDEKEKQWKLSPAYDLTYSNSIGGEHATTINGEGKTPTLEDILAVANNAGISQKYAKKRAQEIQEIVLNRLKQYL